MHDPATTNEARLLETYRDAQHNDQVLLEQILIAWASLSPAQRQTLYRTADLFVSASRWRTERVPSDAPRWPW